MFLGIFAGFGLMLGLYSLVYSPWQENRNLAKRLESEFDEKSATLSGLDARSAKLKALLKRSAPASESDAKREYSEMLSKLREASGIPVGNYSLTWKGAPGDASKVPPLPGTKTPSYTRTSYAIGLKKVSLPMLVKFLEGYYQQPVLQQITQFDIKHAAGDGGAGGTGKRREKEARDDLDATIVTEVVIIETPGAPRSQTLPTAIPGFSQLAHKNEDYKLLEANDPFHGLLPPKWVDVKREKDPDPPKPPPEDISPFIKLNGITWRPDGSATADIFDVANKLDYEVNRAFNIHGEMGISVKKFFYLNSGRKVPETTDVLEIRVDSDSRERHFKVLDFTHEGLILSELLVVATDEKHEEEDISSEEKSKEDTKAPAKSSKTKGKTYSNKTTGKKPATASKGGPQQLGAAVGGFAFAQPAEKRYLWTIGSPLSKLVALGSASKAREESPMPRENLTEK
jgi:hypothetical protein